MVNVTAFGALGLRIELDRDLVMLHSAGSTPASPVYARFARRETLRVSQIHASLALPIRDTGKFIIYARFAR